MRDVRFPPGFRLDGLRGEHPRDQFRSGEPAVDDWLATKALQHQAKHLSSTTVLLDESGAVVGYYTLAMGQVGFGELPANVIKRLPRRVLPVAVLAWLGIEFSRHGQGFGRRLLAQALRDCWEAGKTFPFVAVVVDCRNEPARQLYHRYDFEELPGQRDRLYLSAKRLEIIMTGEERGEGSLIP